MIYFLFVVIAKLPSVVIARSGTTKQSSQISAAYAAQNKYRASKLAHYLTGLLRPFGSRNDGGGNFAITFFAFFLIVFPLYAGSPFFSLFFTKEEQQVFNKGSTMSLEDDSLHLQAILYSDRLNWSFWLNGQHVTPLTVPSSMDIQEVTPDEVCFFWLKEGEKRSITLKVNESVNLKDG